MAEVFPLNGPAIACKLQTEIDSATPSFNNMLGLAQCNVSISCTNFEREGIRYYKITGTCAINSEVTSRKVAVEAHSLL